MGTLNLGLESLNNGFGSKSKGVAGMVVKIGNMHNAQYAVDIASKKVVAIICKDRAVRDAISSLQDAKATIKTYGASESIMSLFNSENELANALGIYIPKVTSINSSLVGVACCEAIDEKTAEAYDLVKTFFNELVCNVEKFVEDLQEVTGRQKDTLLSVGNGLLNDITKIDGTEFANTPVFGYSNVAFNERLSALNGIVDGLGDCEVSEDGISQFKPMLELLGYTVVGEGEVEETDEVGLETEVEEVETEVEEVSDVTEEIVIEQSTDASVESILAEAENNEPIVDPVIEESDTPSTEPTQKTMATFGWNPETIAASARGMCALLDKAGNLRSVRNRIFDLKNKAFSAIDALQEPVSSDVVEEIVSAGAPETETELDIEETIEETHIDETPEPTVEPEIVSTEGLQGTTCIESCRIYAGFFGTALSVWNKSVGEMVNQLITMMGKLKEAEVSNDAPGAVQIEEVTTDEPAGTVDEESPAIVESIEESPNNNNEVNLMFHNENEGGVCPPEYVPEAEPLVLEGVGEETEPQPPGDVVHIEEVETPEDDQFETDLPGEDDDDVDGSSDDPAPDTIPETFEEFEAREGGSDDDVVETAPDDFEEVEDEEGGSDDDANVVPDAIDDGSDADVGTSEEALFQWKF